MYTTVTNQVISDRWKGPSDRNALNIINSNLMHLQEVLIVLKGFQNSDLMQFDSLIFKQRF